jgi:hypothetical protein
MAMKKANLDLYTDYLLSSCGLATATWLSAQVKSTVRQIAYTEKSVGSKWSLIG